MHKTLLVAVLVWSLSACAPTTKELVDQPSEYPATSAIVDDWMMQWMTVDREFAGALLFRRFKDPFYVLAREIRWIDDHSGTHEDVVVPEGFVTDFASIPRVFYSLLKPDDEYAAAAVIHDYMYWDQSTSRAEADLIFKYAMKDLDVGGVTTAAIYNAVRVFGGIAWKQNAVQKSNGERRILTSFPDDVTTTWEQWKKEPGNFQ